jgi:hypothetical protein
MTGSLKTYTQKKYMAQSKLGYILVMCVIIILFASVEPLKR